MAGRHWRYLRFNLYPCGWMAFNTYTYYCDGMALAVFEGNPYPCGRTALTAFDTNTYSHDGTALAAFEATTKIPLSEGPAALICQGPSGPPLVRICVELSSVLFQVTCLCLSSLPLQHQLSQ